MSCPPGFCARSAACQDYLCPGHPRVSEEEMDQPLDTPSSLVNRFLWWGTVVVAVLAAFFWAFR